MANQFPSGLNSYVTGASSVTLTVAGHAAAHNAYEAKIGTGSSTPVNNTVLRGNGTGSSGWAQVALSTDVTGTLVVANGGTGAATLTGVVIGNGTSAFSTVTAPAGVIVGTTDTQTMSGKTLTTPVIASFYQDAGLTKLMTVPSVSSDTVALIAATQTFTNKRHTKRVGTVTSSATPSINTDNVDMFTITALALAITSMTTNLSGTPTNGDTLIIRILDNGSARAITWGASFVSRGATLPTTTVLSKYLYVGLIWNSTASIWDCIAVATEA